LKLASGSLEMSEKMSEKTSEKILAALRQDGSLTIAELASRIGVQNRTIERNIKRLQEQDRLRRVGPDKGGRWEVIEGKNE
jgi:ATP-dependent DNA helicase RecG